MRLLIFTQKVDSEDPILGFFCGWITALSKEIDTIHIICLEEGEHDLPNNVTVYSLGKEQGANKMEYIIHFWEHLYVVSGLYDKVFIHMNQEYLLLGGLYWKLRQIPVYFWRNHPYGNFLTKIAVFLSTKVFCTSKESYTARFNNTIIMPAGINTKMFRPIQEIQRKKNSVCMVGRISPIKRIDLSLKAIKLLIDSGTQISLSIIGSPLKDDLLYFDSLKKYVVDNKLSSYIQFSDAVPQSQLPEIYSSYEICLNLTESGSFDKTIVESASCGAIPLVSNESLRGILPDSCLTQADAKSIADSIKNVLNAPVRLETNQELEKFAKSQSLDELVRRLIEEINHGI
jgi:glycosyltransferase involved in cell wall biosynthesis